MSDKRHLFNKYKSGKDLVNAAEKSENVVSIRQGKGDHVFITTKEHGSISVPMHREIATDLRWKIIRFFIKAGIILWFLAYVYLQIT